MFNKLIASFSLSIIYFLSANADTLNFSGYTWKIATTNADLPYISVGAGLNVLPNDTIWGYDGGCWYDSHFVPYLGSDSCIHVPFARRSNQYVSDTVLQNHLIWKKDTLGKLYRASFPRIEQYRTDSIFVDGVYRMCSSGSLWYNNNISTTTFFRYGKFHWEIKSNFDSLNDAINPGVWIYDDANWVNCHNEIDFEFSKFFSSNTAMGKLQYGVQPTRGPDANYNARVHHVHQPPTTNGITTLEFTYKPESVNFHCQTPNHDSAWTFPAGDTTGLRRHGDSVRVDANGNQIYDPYSGTVVPTNNILLAECGHLTRAKMSILLSDAIWHQPDSTHIPGSPDSVELVVKSFHWTGIPDLSFTDTLGAPWPWPWQQAESWKPQNWPASMFIDTLSYTTHNANHYFWHEHHPYVYFAVHNIGTATSPAGFHTKIYIDNTFYRDTVCTDTLMVGAVYLDSIPLPPLDVGLHHIRVLVNADTATMFDELRRSNDAIRYYSLRQSTES